MAAAVLLAGALIFTPGVFAESHQKAYKIGGIFSVTGPASFLGDPEKKSMELAIEEINAAGGVDGRMLEPVIYDTEGDPSKTVMAVGKLINKDRVTAIIGPSRTPTTLAVTPMVKRAEIPFISCAAGNKIVEPVKPWVFKTAQSDTQAVASIYEHIQQRDIQKVGIITVANSFGESGKEQLLAQAGDFGITVVSSQSFGASDTDMTAQLTKIRQEKPGAIICWGTNPGPAVVAKNAKQLGIEIPLYQSHGVASPKFIELAGDAAEGIFLPTGKILVADLLADNDPQKQVLADYINAYESKYNETVSGFGGYAYDAVHLLARAMEGTNGDKAEIRKNLETLKNYVGISGVFNFSKTDHNGLDPSAFVMVKIKDGKWQLLE
ncbi:MAG: ABC transporter substrate-binding protein [Desulfobacterales bacterium]|nr:ABC transporter substrate-binding protein [Desulfobacterales bacterium]MBS3754161.1 ABC transporter substrate-binding protein [Desulfobacterales bacterium]